MTETAGDGDMGALGTDNVGAAGQGVSPDLYNAFRDALDDFSAACRDADAAAKNVDQAVALLQGWVTVGQKALEIAGPLLARLGRETPKQPDGQPATVPPWYGEATKIGQALEGIRSGFAASLNPLFQRSA